MKLLNKIINKYLSFKKRIKFYNSKNNKNVLISYVLIPNFYISSYYRSSHNNKLQCYLIVQYFFNKGYNVYLYDYLNYKVDTSIKYDIFIGHNISFESISNCVEKSKVIPKILLATGSEPNFGNLQQEKRRIDLLNRNGFSIPLYSNNIVPDLNKVYLKADRILLLGNDFVKSSYGVNLRKKIRLINNVTLHPYFEESSTYSRTNNFLFISSVGQVHRGLDILLDVFKEFPDSKLYVLSSFKQEEDFLKYYSSSLLNSSNIIPVGYMNFNNENIKQIVSKVDFVILPSCSEGQSSSIINMMAYGLVPIATENVGLPNLDDYGIVIDNINVFQGVKDSIKLAINLTDHEYEKKRVSVKAALGLFKKENFVKSLNSLISEFYNL